MEYRNILKLIESLVAKNKRTSLTDLQRAILSDCWLNPRVTYEEIARKQGYSVKYIKQDVGPKLWQLLSEICEEKVKKNNFRSAIERLSVDRQYCDREWGGASSQCLPKADQDASAFALDHCCQH